jgi:hypothetical protein
MRSDRGPLDAAYERYRELEAELSGHVETFADIKKVRLEQFNQLLKDYPAVVEPKEKQ